MMTSIVQTQSPGPLAVLPRRLQLGRMVSFAPGATVRPSSFCWSTVRLLKVGVKLASRRAAVTPTGPQLPPIASKAITAASASETRTGIAQPCLRDTGVPAKSRRRRISHETLRQPMIQMRLTTIPISIGP